MMNHFVIRYVPGGMGLSHSGWWLCEKISYGDGTYFDRPQKYLRRSDYK
jgi:hypothetical protein